MLVIHDSRFTSASNIDVALHDNNKLLIWTTFFALTITLLHDLPHCLTQYSAHSCPSGRSIGSKMQYLLVQETFTGSISLTDDNSIKLGNQLPDSVRSRFRESYQNLVDGTSSTTAADFDEILLELVGDVVNSKLTILHAIGLLLTINFTDSMQVMKALADALWFWSTQVRSQRNKYFSTRRDNP